VLEIDDYGWIVVGGGMSHLLVWELPESALHRLKRHINKAPSRKLAVQFEPPPPQTP